jgi:hypothetical protein
MFKQINDSTFSEKVYKNEKIELELVNSAFKYHLIIKYEDTIINLNFQKANIPAKTPELKWVNKDFICISTWWSASFSRYIFISLNKYKPYFYIDKSLELVDQETNRIVYIDTIMPNKLTFKVLNIITKAESKIQIPKSKNNDEYPYYKSIEIKNNYLLIRTVDKNHCFKI